MYSIIVPTIWRGDEIRLMLPYIDKHPLIGEIIIINNAVNNTPDWFLNSTYTKVRTFDMSQNTYVNPAWNIGVRNATYDKICLLSDDVFFDPQVFEVLNDKLSPNDGCAGPAMLPPHNISAGIEVQNRTPNLNMTNGYGILLFFNKQNYVPIPKPLKIYFGDVWIYMQSIIQNKEPRMLHNFNIRTVLGTSSTTDTFNKVASDDFIWWRTNINSWDDIVNYKET